MKKFGFKRFSMLFCLLACVFSLTACSQQISTDTVKESNKANELKLSEEKILEWSEDMVNYLDKNTNEAIREAAEKGRNLSEINGVEYIVNAKGVNVATVEFYNSWAKTREDLGSLKSIKNKKVVISEETGVLCMVTIEADYADRECLFELMITEDLELESGAINPTYTVGEKMEKAMLNTLIGMGVVFVVLIFISYIISLFKYINIFTDRKNKKQEDNSSGVDNAIAQIVTSEENEADDLELVAVITAAIAAAEGSSSDGLVVRSIRRRR